MDRPQVAVQLIIFGERAQSDLPAVLADVSAAGYDGFEGGAPAGPEQVAAVRAAMADTSLSYIGGHCGAPQLQDPTTAKALAEGVKALGGEFLICSGGSDWNTVDDCRSRGLQRSRRGLPEDGYCPLLSQPLLGVQTDRRHQADPRARRAHRS